MVQLTVDGREPSGVAYGKVVRLGLWLVKRACDYFCVTSAMWVGDVGTID